MDWHCHGCGEIVDEHVLKCPRCGAVHPSAADRPSAGPERDLRMESHLRAVALWLRLGGLAGVVAAALTFFFPIELPLPTLRLQQAYRWLLLLGSGAAYWAGRHLERYSDRARGWAGSLLLFVSLALLAQIVLWAAARSWTSLAAPATGFACAIAAATALFHPRAGRVCTGAYRARLSGPPPPARRSVLLWLPLVPAGVHGLTRWWA